MREGYCGDKRRGTGVRRAAALLGAAVVAVAALAGQARADDLQPVVPVPAATLPVVPVSVDAGPAAEVSAVQATVDTAVAATAGAVQVAASNTNISVRVLSPGDNGAVTQVNAAGADTTAAQGDITAPQTQAPSAPATAPAGTPAAAPSAVSTAQHQDAGAQAAAGQAAPSNTNISVRVLSPGDDGPVTQTNQAGAGSGAANAAADPTTHASAPAPTPAPTGGAAQTAPATTPAPSAGPSVWNWNWSWNCAPTSDIAAAVAAATAGTNWNWNWNWNSSCGTPSGGVTTPATPAPAPPANNQSGNSPVIPQYQDPAPQYQPPAPVATDLLGGLADGLDSIAQATTGDLSRATATASQVQSAVQAVIQDVPAWPSGPWGPALPSIPWLPQRPQVIPTPPASPSLPVPTPGSIVAAVDSILADAGLGARADVFKVKLPRQPRVVPRAVQPRVTILWPAAAQPTTTLSLTQVAVAPPHARSVQPHASAAPASTHVRSPQRAPRDPDPRGPGDGMGAVESGTGLGGLLLPTIAALLGACLLLPPRRFRRPVGRRARLPQQPRAERRDRPG